ncbi:hypothetical protein EVAR_99014_1 [Eumeta japonica]|uniref:Uncharacterized protein n=1 Tax=Eumeta variegata TaxID=151549 RepID=A0A4C1Y195_EUMVA|nr:hypothetical protein EVAR_99014_1 [Eumeta japonica]
MTEREVEEKRCSTWLIELSHVGRRDASSHGDVAVLARRCNVTWHVTAPFHVDDVVMWRCGQALMQAAMHACVLPNTSAAPQTDLRDTAATDVFTKTHWYGRSLRSMDAECGRRCAPTTLRTARRLRDVLRRGNDFKLRTDTSGDGPRRLH